MKKMRFLAVGLMGLTLGLTACSRYSRYEYVYLRAITVDGEDVPESLHMLVSEQLGEGGLPVLDKAEMRELTPQQRQQTMKVVIEIEHKETKVEADLSIENLQTDRDVKEFECEAGLGDEAAVEQTLQCVIDEAVGYIKSQRQ